MRVVELRGLTQPASSHLLAHMDHFAALNARLGSDPAIGGFRFVRAKEARCPSFLSHILRRRAGLVSLIFIGGLGLSVLARPASEPPPGSLDSAPLHRLAYAPPPASAEGSGEAAGAAPSRITTSALPAQTAAPAREVRAQPEYVGPLTAAIETLTESPPKLIRLAATAPMEDVPMLPLVEIATPDDALAAELEKEPEAAGRPQTRIERKASRRHVRKTRTPAGASSKKLVRAPRWAKQMFETPWQTAAFSYIR